MTKKNIGFRSTEPQARRVLNQILATQKKAKKKAKPKKRVARRK